MLRCQSGRMCTLGKRVYGNVPGVQIPPAAPIKQKKSRYEVNPVGVTKK